MRLQTVGASDCGRVRSKNEDRYFCDGAKRMGILCDGVGGAQGGAVAAGLVVDELRASFSKMTKVTPQKLRDCVIQVNKTVLYQSTKDPSLSGMATTLVAFLGSGTQLHLVHVGDSRAYLYSGRTASLQLLTLDHSVENLVAAGDLPREAGDLQPRKALASYLGKEDLSRVDTSTITLQPDDILLCASDGLFNMVPEGDITELLHSHSDLELLSDLLIDRANKNGGKDNITVILARVETQV